MADDRLRHSLEDLFSDDVPPPRPERPRAPVTPPEAEPVPTPAVELLAEVEAAPVEARRPAVDVTPPARERQRGLTIRRRLTIGFLVVLALLLLSGVANFLAISWLDQAASNSEREVQRVAAASQAARVSADLLVILDEAATSQDAARLVETLGPARADLNEAIGNLSATSQDLPEDDAVFVEVRRAQSRMAGVDFMAGLVVPARRGRYQAA